MKKIRHSQSFICQLPYNFGVLEITPDALNHFENFKQNCLFSKEAGGQLFVAIENSIYKLTTVTGPRKKDKRSRYSYSPDHTEELIEIDYFFAQGLHYLGDWHTHPQNIPTPSSDDRSKFESIVKRSTDGLNFYILFIIGTSDFPDGLYICFYNKEKKQEIKPHQISIKSDT